MVKTKRLCLIAGKSGNQCRDCALYRARHHYICLRDNYRGHQWRQGEVSDAVVPHTPGPSRNHKFDSPNNKRGKSINIITKEREEGI
jgi:hypothetical protein